MRAGRISTQLSLYQQPSLLLPCPGGKGFKETRDENKLGKGFRKIRDENKLGKGFRKIRDENKGTAEPGLAGSKNQKLDKHIRICYNIIRSNK